MLPDQIASSLFAALGSSYKIEGGIETVKVTIQHLRGTDGKPVWLLVKSIGNGKSIITDDGHTLGQFVSVPEWATVLLQRSYITVTDNQITKEINDRGMGEAILSIALCINTIAALKAIIR